MRKEKRYDIISLFTSLNMRKGKRYDIISLFTSLDMRTEKRYDIISLFTSLNMRKEKRYDIIRLHLLPLEPQFQPQKEKKMLRSWLLNFIQGS